MWVTGFGMSDTQQNTGGASARDTPEQRQRVARMLVILSPFMFLFCLFLARIQDAPWSSALIIAAAGVAMCLVAAILYSLRGSKSVDDLFWLNIVLRLFR
jgi:chromate transport protein ChrA